MKMIKNLNMNIVKKNIGFNRREDLDFEDDGNHFKGYDYKGLPITTLRSDGNTFLAIREDYLNNNFTFDDWRKTEEYKLTDEFNYCSEVDLDKLIENCERIVKKIEEMNKQMETEEVDTTKAEERIAEEIYMVKGLICDVKKDLEWWNLREYDLKRAADMLRYEERELKQLQSMDFSTMEIREKRKIVQGVEEYGYVKFRMDDFYSKELREMIVKSQEVEE